MIRSVRAPGSVCYRLANFRAKRMPDNQIIVLFGCGLATPMTHAFLDDVEVVQTILWRTRDEPNGPGHVRPPGALVDSYLDCTAPRSTSGDSKRGALFRDLSPECIRDRDF